VSKEQKQEQETVHLTSLTSDQKTWEHHLDQLEELPVLVYCAVQTTGGALGTQIAGNVF
jgi:hypothetical protein